MMAPDAMGTSATIYFWYEGDVESVLVTELAQKYVWMT
jgi:hypothetical protein